MPSATITKNRPDGGRVGALKDVVERLPESVARKPQARLGRGSRCYTALHLVTPLEVRSQVTTPQADGADRIPGVAQRQSSAGAAVGSLAVVLLVGLLLRLTIAYVLLPGSGFESDIATFTAWAFQLGQQGPGDFYATTAFADYPPGYLYVLWLIGGLGELLAPLSAGGAAAVTGALIKIPPILADVAIGALLFYLVRSWLGRGPRAHRLGIIA